jgi:hypothetical protein
MACQTEDEMKEILAAAVAKAGSVAALAREMDGEIQEQYLGRMVSGRDPINAKLAEKLGYRRLTVFEKIRKVAPTAVVE